MNILMLLAALALSSIAAFYSIAGLAAIFAAAVIPIVVMGSILEVSKLVVASWLYRNWDDLPKLLKSYFLVAVIILMMLTSMGIFGFLSKAHLDQAVPTGDVQAKIELIDEKIKSQKETINEARTTLSQLDKQVNETISRTANATDTKAIDRSVQIRKQQSKERKQLYEAISSSQAEISKLQQEKAPLAQQARKIEAEVGPIKYIAALIYGDNPDQNLLEKAVRWVIIMIVSVFDPLAVLMLVGYNWTLNRRKEEPELHDMSYYSDSKWTEEELKQADRDSIVDEAYAEYKTMEKSLNDAKIPEGWVNDFIPSKEEWPPYEPREEKKDWDPTLYKGLDEPDVNAEIQKLFEGDDVIKTPAPPPPEESVGVKTIEQEVEDLQRRKPIEYDSAGRRITP